MVTGATCGRSSGEKVLTFAPCKPVPNGAAQATIMTAVSGTMRNPDGLEKAEVVIGNDNYHGLRVTHAVGGTVGDWAGQSPRRVG